jgi:ribosome-associated translation inhibitor RaiA/cold shock CspA family protein
MQSPLELSFKEMPHSDALEALVRQRVARLERFYDKITHCYVVIEPAHRNQRKGVHYEVRVHVGVPAHELIVDRQPGRLERHERPDAAVRDAFDAMEKQLKGWIQQVRGDVKTHEEPEVGRVASLFPHEEHGFIQAPDGTEVYFHRNALVDFEFEDLEVGTPVTWVEFQAPEGPQASTVRVL